MPKHNQTLYMIYNADGGLLNAIKDSFHKKFAPDSYPCALCALAFGFFTVHGEWTRFLESVPLEKKELHRDDFREELSNLELRLPVIIVQSETGEIKPIVTAGEMEAMDDLDQLIGLAQKRLSEAGIKLSAPA